MKKKSNKKGKSFFILVFIIVFSIYGFNKVDRSIKPTVLALSEMEARMVATQAINEAIEEKLKDTIKYKDLVFVNYDSEGKVTMMQANIVLMNNIASELALEVQNNIAKIGTESLTIPLGTVFNSQILSQWGPKITMDIVPQGTVNVDFATEFEESGINQTRHRIYLVIMVDVRVVIPLASDKIRVTMNTPIAETVIVGDVPSSYISVPKDAILDVIE